jgi:nicotinamidase-related amidase
MLARCNESALVVIDVQERLAAAMDPPVFARLLRNTRILVHAAQRLGIPIVATEQYPKGLGPTVPALAESLADTPRIEKTCFSCASLAQAGERGQLILAGMEAHVCVLQSALEWRAGGREVFVVEDACCSRAAENHANALQRMRAAGVIVTNIESVLFEWMRDARHDQFKAISSLLR